MELLHTVYEPAGEGPHPTVIAFHGWGANAMDLLGLAPYLAGGRVLVLCPQGPVTVPLGPMDGYGWFPLTMGGPPDAGAFADGVGAARRFIREAVLRYPVDQKHLALLGFSQGGAIAYALGLAEPEHFATMVALSTWLPATLAEALPAVPRQHLPTLVHHGAQDEVIDVARGRESVELLRTLNVPVTYREFGMGHEINADSLADFSTWLQKHLFSSLILPA